MSDKAPDPEATTPVIKRARMVVLGAGGAVGAEICRIGRSIGHEMVGVLPGGRGSAPEERWVEGIDWLDGGPTDHGWEAALQQADAAIWLWRDRSGVDRARRALPTGRDGRPRLIVLAGDAAPADGISLSDPSDSDESEADSPTHPLTITLESPPLYGTEPSPDDAAPIGQTPAAAEQTSDAGANQPDETADDTEAQPFEVLAIAALRAAVEPEVAPRLDAAAVTRLGRAVYLQ